MNAKSAAILVLLAAIGVTLAASFGLFDPDPSQPPETGIEEAPTDAGPADVASGPGPEPAPAAEIAELVASETDVGRTSAGPEPSRTDELTDEELRDFQRISPDGTLEGLVLRGSAPVARAEVHLWNALTDPRKTNAPGESVGTWETTTDDDGEFAFEDLAEGTYRVRVDLEDGSTLDAQDSIRSGRTRERLLLVFGGATLEGHVYDPYGAPVPEIYVRAVRQGTQPGGFAKAAWTITDREGAYRLSGLQSGRYRIYAEPDRTARPGSGDMRLTDLKANETKTVDFGQVEGLPTWSGVVRDSVGDMVPGVRRIYLLHADERLAKTFETLPQGVFRERVPAGTYTVAVDATGYRIEAGDLSFGTEDVQADIEIGGTRVDIHLELPPGAEPVEELAKKIDLVLLRTGWESPYPPPYGELYPVLREGATLTYLAVDPIVHALSRPIGKRLESLNLEIEVPEGEAHFETWVTVDAP